MSAFDYIILNLEKIEKDLMAKPKLKKNDKTILLNNAQLMLCFKMIGKEDFDLHFNSYLDSAKKESDVLSTFFYTFHKSFRQIDVCDKFRKDIKIYDYCILPEDPQKIKFSYRSPNGIIDSLIWTGLKGANSFFDVSTTFITDTENNEL